MCSESCAADRSKEQRKKEHKQLYKFLPQTGSSPVLLALPRRVPLKCNLKLQVAQSHKRDTYLCSRTTPRDFYAQSHKKETSHTRKRLLCSRTTPRDFYAQSHKKETSKQLQRIEYNLNT